MRLKKAITKFFVFVDTFTEAKQSCPWATSIIKDPKFGFWCFAPDSLVRRWQYDNGENLLV